MPEEYGRPCFKGFCLLEEYKMAYREVVCLHDEYSKAYTTLFNAVTDALEAIRKNNYGQAEELLKNGQIEAEEKFLQAGEDRE